MLAMALTVATLLAAAPAPAAAATATLAEVGSMLLTRLNADRVAAGLTGYRAWPALATLATERATRMAATSTLSHQAAGGDIGDALDARGINWMGYGEVIANSGDAWGADAVAHIYGMWWNSAPHHAIMMSTTSNYIGFGVAQAADGSTWVSAITTESADHTAPVARNRSLYLRYRDDIVFRWSGADPRLQTHTAGIRSYDVQMRRDAGLWRTIRDNTTATGLVLPDRAHRHWYRFRVQAADRRGNLSRWTSEIRIWVP
jgi:uncharacterized protein YkwD